MVKVVKYIKQKMTSLITILMRYIDVNIRKLRSPINI